MSVSITFGHRLSSKGWVCSYESSERSDLLGSSFPEELLPEQLPESEPDEESEDWKEFL